MLIIFLPLSHAIKSRAVSHKLWYVICQKYSYLCLMLQCAMTMMKMSVPVTVV